MGLLSRVFSRADEPMVDEQMGQFSDLRVPVSHTSGPALWSMSPADRDYLTPQTQEEHNRLLNTFYEDRKSMPNWRELGQRVEQRDPRYSDKDSTTRKSLGAKSSVIQDMAFDKEHNLAMLKMGGNWYTYSSTPEQFQKFLMSGSLGREMNNIKNGRSTSMMKTAARKTPSFKSSSPISSSVSGISRIARLFGF
jgi:hypothetical protein